MINWNSVQSATLIVTMKNGEMMAHDIEVNTPWGVVAEVCGVGTNLPESSDKPAPYLDRPLKAA